MKTVKHFAAPSYKGENCLTMSRGELIGVVVTVLINEQDDEWCKRKILNFLNEYFMIDK